MSTIPLGANADDEKAYAADKQKILNEQDAVYAQTENYFRNYSKTLIRAGKLIFDFEVVSVVPSEIEDIPDGYNICSSYEMADIFAAYSHPLDDETYQKVRSTLQRVAGLRPAVENDNVSEDDIVSLGGKMAHINRAIKNMDQDRHDAANEFTKAPLRIRGIAGSGKTIVLAGRAAYIIAPKATRLPWFTCSMPIVAPAVQSKPGTNFSRQLPEQKVGSEYAASAKAWTSSPRK